MSRTLVLWLRPPSDELLSCSFSGCVVTVWPRHKVQLWALRLGRSEQLKLERSSPCSHSTQGGGEIYRFGLGTRKGLSCSSGKKAGAWPSVLFQRYLWSLTSQRVDSNKLFLHMALVALNRHSGKYCSRSVVGPRNYFTQVTCRTKVFIIIFFNVIKFPWLQHLGKP